MSYQLVLEPTDRAFYDTIREGTLPPDEFKYVTAVRAAWTVIAHAPSLAEGIEGAVKLLRYYKVKTNTYHTCNDTWTKFYVWVVAWSCLQCDAEWGEFWAWFSSRFPQEVWEEYYSTGRWNGQAARGMFLPPDRRHLPRIEGVEL